MNSVLFLCTGNFYRSRFAEEYFNHRANTVGMNWRAASRGLVRDMTTTGNIGPMATDSLEALRELGIHAKDASRFPTSVAADDFETHDHVVALSRCEHQPMIEMLFPDYLDRVEYFDIEDGHLEPVTTALPRLSRLIDLLLERLLRTTEL